MSKSLACSARVVALTLMLHAAVGCSDPTSDATSSSPSSDDSGPTECPLPCFVDAAGSGDSLVTLVDGGAADDSPMQSDASTDSALSSDVAPDAIAADSSLGSDSAVTDSAVSDSAVSDSAVSDAAATDAVVSTSPYGTWHPIAVPPVSFHQPLQVWTGTEALFYDGTNGAAYDPAADKWRTLSIPALTGVGAAWTGSKLFVYAKNPAATDAGKNTWAFFFDPKTGTRTETSYTGRPGWRTNPVVAWTGDRILVFGGTSSSSVGDGGIYDPATNVWTAMPTSGAPGGAPGVVGYWTGSELLVWGGCAGFTDCLDGAFYSPSKGTWRPMSKTMDPGLNPGATHVWTGTTLYVWGGSFVYSGKTWDSFSGMAYSLATDTWTSLPDSKLAGRYGAIGAWTGSELVLWGGAASFGYDYTDGARFDPALGAWRTMSIDSAPGGCAYGGGVWTGSELVVVPGESESSSMGCGFAAWRP